MDKIKALYFKYKEQINYLVFGALTTLVNIAAFYVCYNIFKIDNDPSVIIAWFLSVLFAFVVNKLWVFSSKSFKKEVLLREALSFFGSRALTGLLDLIIMHIAVKELHLNEMLWKIISNVIVIILNYILSRFLVFKRNKSD